MDKEEDWFVGRLVEWKEHVETVSFSCPVALIFYDTYVFRGSFVVRFVYFSPFLEERFWSVERKAGSCVGSTYLLVPKIELHCAF
jgi:hypothetical protein